MPTRFAATWYAQHGYNPGRSGDADGQARAKNTSLSGIEAAGIGEGTRGDVPRSSVLSLILSGMLLPTIA